MKVNLLKERNQAYSINWMEIIVIIVVVLFVIGTGVHYFTLYNQRSILEDEVVSLNSQVATLRIKVAEYNKLKERVEELTRIKEKMDTLKYVWDKAIIEQGYVNPGQVMIDNLNIEGNHLEINGKSASNQRILDLIDYMKVSPIYSNVSLKDVQAEGDDSTFQVDALIVDEEGDQ